MVERREIVGAWLPEIERFVASATIEARKPGRRVDATELDDVLQDVLVRVQRGLSGLRDEERFASWLFQIARSSIAEHRRMRARHPLPDAPDDMEIAAESNDDDREATSALPANERRRVGSRDDARPPRHR